MTLDSKILAIVNKLFEKFMSSTDVSNEISIFLCGGASKEESKFRYLLGKKLSNLKSKYNYSVYYPESMFVELILGHKQYDLLSLENLLASSVTTVVIPLQSPGTYTELGAFANHDGLNNKLTIIIDPKYEFSKSFINTGPIKFLKNQKDSQIIYHSLGLKNIDSLSMRISEAARNISTKHPVIPSLTNPLTSYEFYYAIIFTLDPIPKENVLEIAKILASTEPDLAITVAEAVINSLIKEGKIVQKKTYLTVPMLGVESFIYSCRTTKKSIELLEFLTDLRYQALNHILRGKKYLSWKGAA